jgi:DNA-binding transcriptional regulator YiaG
MAARNAKASGVPEFDVNEILMGVAEKILKEGGAKRDGLAVRETAKVVQPEPEVEAEPATPSEKELRVHAACTAIAARGEKPTIQRVRQELGRGSTAWIAEYLKSWRKINAERAKEEDWREMSKQRIKSIRKDRAKCASTVEFESKFFIGARAMEAYESESSDKEPRMAVKALLRLIEVMPEEVQKALGTLEAR